MNIILLMLVLLAAQPSPQIYINDKASAEFGPSWTAQIKRSLDLCATTVNKLPPSCQDKGFSSVSDGTLLNLSAGHGVSCAWVCEEAEPIVSDSKPLDPCDKDAIKGPFWKLQYGPWKLDTIMGEPQR